MLTTIVDRNDFYKPLAMVPDHEDLALHKDNCAPELLTRRMYELLPLLRFVNCVVQFVGIDKTIVSLPLLDSTMNQNGTQQAAIFYALADCALALGMLGVLPGIYIAGIHDRCRALPIQYWTKHGTVHHIAPGTGTIRAEVRITNESAILLRKQLVEKGRAECHEIVKIYQEDQLVASADFIMGIYSDMPRLPGVRANVLQIQNVKTSALLIAGLRIDNLSRSVTHDQGRAIASRMTLVTPQLPSLIQARTQHIEQYINDEGSLHEQVVVLGIGLDPKPFQFSSSSQCWFGLDFRSMLQEREKRFNLIGAEAKNFIGVASDIRLENWENTLTDAGFMASLSTLFILEGLSMYLSVGELKKLFQKLRSLTSSKHSCIWLDRVTPKVFDLDNFEVESFLSSMARLGEPFVLGFEDANSLAMSEWNATETTSAADVLGISDIIHNEYRFSILRSVL